MSMEISNNGWRSKTIEIRYNDQILDNGDYNNKNVLWQVN
jgi:hypothetical protein